MFLTSKNDSIIAAETIGLGLSRTKREIICNYVIYLHSSFFQTNGPADDMFAEYLHQPLPDKLKALHAIATNFAKSLGASDQEINETVMKTSIHCTYQRSVALDEILQQVQDAPVYRLTGLKAAFA